MDPITLHLITVFAYIATGATVSLFGAVAYHSKIGQKIRQNIGKRIFAIAKA